MHVLIVGAGPGGLAVAQCLRKQGVSFEVFDRDADENARFQGWAIGLHTIIDEIVSSFPPDMPNLKESTDHLAPLDLPAQVTVYFSGATRRIGFEDSSEKPFIRAERLRLRKWMSTNVPIQWDKHATCFEHDDTGVAIHFEDGTVARGDILIGADGTNSRVREHLFGRPNSELLKIVPTAAIVGQVTLSGRAFEHQLELGHSGHNLMNPELGFVSFQGLHEVLPDGLSGRFYWIFMQPDDAVGRSDHWLQKANQREKLDHVLKAVAPLAPKLREIFELTESIGIKEDQHFFRDIELSSFPAVPTGRVVLVGDAAHAMSPFRGEGGYQTFIDALKLSKWLIKLDNEGKIHDIAAVRTAIKEYNREMVERGSESVRVSRNTHKELIGKARMISFLITWVPLLLAIILHFAIDGPIKLKPLPDEKIELKGEKRVQREVDLGFWQRYLSTLFMFLGIARFFPEVLGKVRRLEAVKAKQA